MVLVAPLLFTYRFQICSLTNGAAVRLTGMLADSIGPGQDKELQVHAVDVVGECDPEVSGGSERQLGPDDCLSYPIDVSHSEASLVNGVPPR